MTFHLEIVTPDGVSFDGQAESLYVRTQQGDIGILPNHIDYLAALGMGQARVTVDGQTRTAACIGDGSERKDKEDLHLWLRLGTADPSAGTDRCGRDRLLCASVK